MTPRSGPGAGEAWPVNADLFTFTPADGMFVAEASTIGLLPGVWPRAIILVTRDGSFVYHRDRGVREGGEDLVAVIYRSNDLPTTVHVLND